VDMACSDPAQGQSGWEAVSERPHLSGPAPGSPESGFASRAETSRRAPARQGASRP
jgi:hypothetical protein